MNKQLASNLILLLTSFIWGSAFVAQRAGMEYIGPFTYNAIRFAMAAIVLIPLVVFTINKQKQMSSVDRLNKKKQLIGGLICGLILGTGSTLQQIAIVYTSAGKTAFITALYIVLVPIFGRLLHQKIRFNCWIAVVIAAIGLYLLCITQGFSIAPMDILLLVSACFWAFHLIFVDIFLMRKANSILLAFSQLIIAAIISLVLMLFFEFDSIKWSDIQACTVPLLYAGVLSGGIGFTLQIVGQRHSTPTVASLILSLEAAFGAICGFIFLKEIMSSRELLGCLLMLSAVVISQLPPLPVKKKGRLKQLLH